MERVLVVSLIGSALALVLPRHAHVVDVAKHEENDPAID
jgi:hypothetical protein